jgi:hypothetical protein
MAAFLGSTKASNQALGAATAETLLQLVAATNHRVKLLEWGVSFDGTAVANEPVTVLLERQTTAGTSSAGTMVKMDDSIADTLLTTSRISFTVEPTGGDDIEEVLVHPQTSYTKIYPLGRELIIGGADRVGIVCTAPDAVNASAYFIFEE